MFNFSVFESEFLREEQFLPNMKLGSKVFSELEKASKVVFPESYKEFILRQNGGFFKKGIFHMFSIGYKSNCFDLFGWNQLKGWKAFYVEKAKRQGYDISKIIFFAENIEGDQFGFNLNDPQGNEYGIVFMFAGDGEIVKVTNSFEDLMNRILPLEYTTKQDRFLPTVTYEDHIKSKGIIPAGYHLDTQSYKLLNMPKQTNMVPAEVHMLFLGKAIHENIDVPEGKAKIELPIIQKENMH